MPGERASGRERDGHRRLGDRVLRYDCRHRPPRARRAPGAVSPGASATPECSFPLVSVAVAITLLPVLLATIGPQLDWPRPALPNATGAGSGYRCGRWTVRHRWLAADRWARDHGAARVGRDEPSAPVPGDVGDALEQRRRLRGAAEKLQDCRLGPGALSPFLCACSGRRQQLGDRAGAAGAVGGIRGRPSHPGPRPPEGRGRSRGLPSRRTGSFWGCGRRALRPAEGGRRRARRAGRPVRSADFVDAVYGSFRLMVLLVYASSPSSSSRAPSARCLLPGEGRVPAQPPSPVAAACGVMVLVWQEELSAPSGLGRRRRTGAIVEFIPSDRCLHVPSSGSRWTTRCFILSRIRAEYDRAGSTDEAVSFQESAPPSGS